MSIRTILVLVVSGLLALFAVVNWSTFVTPTHLSLVVTSVDAPLGLAMLGFTAALAAVLLGYALKVQINALSDSRRQSQELRRLRELAEQAEASRFTELRKYLDQELASLRQAQQSAAERLHEEITAATNTLSACIGEVDDRLERQWPTPPERKP
jgi:K+-sensing histidine kinase KdpD